MKTQDFGFYKVGCGVPRIKVANPAYNAGEIIKLMQQAKEAGCSVLVTPELSLSGATCGDLFYQRSLLNACEAAMETILEASKGSSMITVVGLPVACAGKLYNCAAVVQDGLLRGFTPKSILSPRDTCFTSGKEDELFFCECVSYCDRAVYDCGDLRFGIVFGSELYAPDSPAAKLAAEGANLIINLASENELPGTEQGRELQICAQSELLTCGYAYCGAGVYESTTDQVFAGAALLCENGKTLKKGELFRRDTHLTTAVFDLQKMDSLRMKRGGFDGKEHHFVRDILKLPPMELSAYDDPVDPDPCLPRDPAWCDTTLAIQTAGLAKRMEHIAAKKMILGVSGGLDSTLALLVAVNTADLLGLPRENVLGITLPGFGTSDRTYQNAVNLMKALGITLREISIADAVRRHFKDIGQEESVHDVTYENSQARERTQILMDLANKENAVLVGTGDLSEIAMGWCTYNGDHMSMYGVNASIPKTLMRHMVTHVANTMGGEAGAILHDIVDTPVSPELLPPDGEGNIAQKTEDKIGPYRLHDFFLYHFFSFGFAPEKISFLAKKAFEGIYDEATIDRWLKTFLRRFFTSQFKRSCSPDAPQAGPISLSPRGGLRMPSDSDFALWMEAFEG
ncbi:MAG: NAD(+) synthase [Ruminococcaceae bacterium]|nr:NAD(+) synthase [Oscillospiraceae bacterium]